MSAREIVIGDIHGCFHELQTLLHQLDLCSADHLYVIGDVIDKGPDVVRVVNFLGDYAVTHPVTLIEGNHEERFLRWLAHSKSGNIAVANGMHGSCEFAYLAANLSANGLDFLHKGIVATSIAQGAYLLVHAGIPPRMHDASELLLNRKNLSSSARKKLSTVQHIRYLDEQQHPVMLGKELPHHQFWAESYDGRFGTVVFGHHVWMQPKPQYFPYAIGIDLGAVHGGWLCALIISDGAVSYVTVQSGDCYAVLVAD